MNQATVAGKPAALSNPLLPVRWDAGGSGATMRGRREGETRGRKRGGRGSGWQRVFDPQNRGRARRPWPQGGCRDHCVIRWGWRNPRRTSGKT